MSTNMETIESRAIKKVSLDIYRESLNGYENYQKMLEFHAKMIVHSWSTQPPSYMIPKDTLKGSQRV